MGGGSAKSRQKELTDGEPRLLRTQLLHFQLPLVFLSLLRWNSEKQWRVPQVSVCISLVCLSSSRVLDS